MINGAMTTQIRENYEQVGSDRRNRFRQTRITDNGDDTNLLWGDDPFHTTQPGCRFISQNTNGISKSEHYMKAHEIGEAASKINADIIGLSETNLDWKFGTVKSTVNYIFRRYWSHMKACFSSSDKNCEESEYQPGGTALIVGQPWSGRATMTDDQSGLGRWSEATITGRDKRNVTVISAYRCVKNNIRTSGPSTSFSQQWHLLRQKGDPSPDPCERFFSDLGKRISTLQRDKHEIILMMDANDTLQSPNNRFTRWVRQHKLFDIHVRKHGTEEEPPTYARGTKRIDYILTTAEISEFVTAAGILPLHEFVTSDHRALFIDVSLLQYLRGDPNPLAPASCRGLKSNDPRAVRKYRDELEKAITKSGIEADIKDAKTSIKEYGYDDTMAEVLDEIDNRFAQMRLDAEAKCSKINSHPWSPKLRLGQRKVRYWKLWLSELKLGLNLSSLGGEIPA